SVDYPDFYANTYATLKEIFHFILDNSERVRYGVSEIENTDINQGTMPKPIWLITGLNENGISRVSGFDNLSNLVASYLTSEVMSPLESEGGQPNVLVNENPIYDNFDDKGMPKWFSSFGIIKTGMPRAETSSLFAMKLLDKALSDEPGERSKSSDFQCGRQRRNRQADFKKISANCHRRKGKSTALTVIIFKGRLWAGQNFSKNS
ncbi:hypothetical protein J7M00_02505, partial [bacterium]|nr:hypothetical protein [bacterium]